MEPLRKDELILIALELDLPSLLNFCNSSKEIKNNVCENGKFWLTKLQSVGKLNLSTLISNRLASDSLHFIMQNRYFKSLKSIIPSHLQKNHALYFAVNNNYFDATKFLIEKMGANPRLNNDELITIALNRGNKDIVKYLHDKGAPLKINILDAAILADYNELVKYLLENGLKPYLISPYKINSLIITNRELYDILIKYLK